MIRRILSSKDPILRQKSKPVAKLTKKILSLVKDLKDYLGVQKDPEGVGLGPPPRLGKTSEFRGKL